MFKSIYVVLAAVVSAASHGGDLPKTVVDIAVNDPDNFSTLVSLVTSAGLVDALSAADPKLTVFAPTNAAFAALPKATLDAVGADKDLLTKVLTYHVVGAEVLSSTLKDGQEAETLQGGKVHVTVGDSVFINQAKVEIADVKAGNGVVHVIDAVLVPSDVTGTLVALAQATPDFSTLVDLVVAADLVDTLSGRGPFTLFAPTNAAFEKVPKETMDTLGADKELLAKVLTYHVVSGSVWSRNLADGEVKTVQGEDVTVKIHTDHVMINDAKVTGADTPAFNGVIHSIDTVLMPPAATAEPTAEPSSSSHLAASIATMGAAVIALAAAF